MTLSETTEYRVSAKGFNAVKKICSKITNQDSRRRAFKALLCMDTLADCLYSQGFNIDISKNLYKILPLNEEFEFTDIHCNGRFIDVVPVVNGQYVLIPKNHVIFDVVPELYVVADYNQTTKKVRFLGCFEGDKIPKNVENANHYVCDIKNLQSPALVEELLSSVKPEEISEQSHGLFVSFFIDYLDGVLDDTSKKRLVTHLIECKECRSELVEFFDYEMIAKETKKFPEVLNDNTLDIIGAVAANDPKYKDFKEYTIQIEKEKDEYEEDEEENSGGKQIKSAIEDPLQILYGKNKNQKIFDLMGERPKKPSMLDSVMSDIAKTPKKPANQELTKEDTNISYKGSINPEYYAEGLPEGTDIDVEPKNDLNLDFDYMPKSTKKDEDFEIVEEDDVLNIDDDNNIQTADTKKVSIPHSLKSDVDKPQFSQQLNPAEETPVSTNDEFILLDEEKSVDEPEFASQLKPQTDVKPAENNEYDDFITIEDDSDDLSVLKKSDADDELPNSMDNIVYYDDEDETSQNKSDENDDVIEIIDEDDDVLGIEIPLKKEEKTEDEPIINLHEELSDTLEKAKNQTAENPDVVDDISTSDILSDTFVTSDTTKDEAPVVLEDNNDDVSDELEFISDKTSVVETPETLDIIDDEDEISDDDLIHFDAVDIDIVDENDLEQQSVIPATIEDAGVAASSLIDDFEDGTKESLAKNIAKDIAKDTIGFVAQKTIETGVNDVLNKVTTGAEIASEIADIGGLFVKNADKSHQKADSLTKNTISANDEEDDLLVINDDEDLELPKQNTTSTPQNTISVNEKEEKNYDDLLFIDDDDFNVPPSTSIDATNDTISIKSNDDDFVVIDEDETDNLKSVSIPTNVPQDDEFEVIDDDNNTPLQFLNDTNSGKDDFVVIDEDEADSLKSVSIPTNVPQDDEFEVIDDDNNSPLQFLNDTNSGDDDFVVIDEDETDSLKSVSIPTDVEEDDDLVIIDDENDIQNPEKLINKPENTNSVDDDFVIIDDDDTQNNAHNTNSVIEQSDDEITDEIHDSLLDDLPMIRKEDIVAQEQKPQEKPISEQPVVAPQPIELKDDESGLLSFGDEDDTGLLSFGDDQDFLLESEDDSFMLKEESPAEPIVQQPQPIPEPIVEKKIEPAPQPVEEDEEDDLIIIDDDNLSPLAPEKPASTINNTNSVDDDMVIIDDEDDSSSNNLTPANSDFEPISDNADDSINFFRPAGASFDYNDSNTDDFVPMSNVEPEKQNADDDMLILDDEDDNSLDIQPIEPEQSVEDNQEDEIELIDEEEEKPQEEVKKPVSQLDLIFKSLSDREREQIAAVQSGKTNQDNPQTQEVEDKKEEVADKKEEVVSPLISTTDLSTTETLPEKPKTSMFSRNFKDAIAAKDEAVEEGRISLKPTEGPVVDPLINTTVQKIDEDEYEEVHVEDDDEEHSVENTDEEGVEYVYEEEDGDYVPQDGEEVEYVYEDEDGNIITDEDEIAELNKESEVHEEEENSSKTAETPQASDVVAQKSDESLDEDIDMLPEIDDVQPEEDEFTEDNTISENTDDYGDYDDSEFDDNVTSEDENPEDISDEDSDDEAEDEESEESDEQEKKKAMFKKAAIAAAVVLVIVGAGFASKVILSNNNARAEQQALNEGASIGDVGGEEEGGLAVPEDAQSPTGGQLEEPTVGGEEGGLSIPENDADALGGAEAPAATPSTPSTPATPVAEQPQGPKAGTPNATTSDLNKAVANAFSDSPTSMTVRKASWGVGASLAADADFKAYLQKMGKSVKSVLRKNLASAKGEAPATPVKVQIKMSDTGNLQDVIILKSCGNTQVDEIVLQSVKQTVAACPFPELAENTLKANQKATGGNTVKMSLTVTF